MGHLHERWPFFIWVATCVAGLLYTQRFYPLSDTDLTEAR